MTNNQSENQGKWPDFIGIGAIKSGTTWLHACLAEHPAIHTPGTKELEFFTDRYHLGPDWYQSNFANPGNLLAGESTPAYLHTPGCAARIHATVPTAKLLVCLRNPIERAFSHFMMANRESTLTADEKLRQFDSEIRMPDNKYVRYGYYAEQLTPYLSLFGADRIHCVLYDDINNDPAVVVAETFEFLGVDNEFVPQTLHRRINPAARYRNARLFSLLRKAVQFTEQHVLAGLILWMKTSGIRDRVLNWWRIPHANIEMLRESREYLGELYAPANRDLANLINADLSRWNEPTAAHSDSP